MGKFCLLVELHWEGPAPAPGSPFYVSGRLIILFVRATASVLTSAMEETTIVSPGKLNLAVNNPLRYSESIHLLEANINAVEWNV